MSFSFVDVFPFPNFPLFLISPFFGYQFGSFIFFSLCLGVSSCFFSLSANNQELGQPFIEVIYPGTHSYLNQINSITQDRKGLLYIVDGIWGGESWEGFITKFKSDPFNDDYPNSIFVGQDPVALESWLPCLL